MQADRQELIGYDEGYLRQMMGNARQINFPRNPQLGDLDIQTMPNN